MRFKFSSLIKNLISIQKEALVSKALVLCLKSGKWCVICGERWRSVS